MGPADRTSDIAFASRPCIVPGRRNYARNDGCWGQFSEQATSPATVAWHTCPFGAGYALPNLHFTARRSVPDRSQPNVAPSLGPKLSEHNCCAVQSTVAAGRGSPCSLPPHLSPRLAPLVLVHVPAGFSIAAGGGMSPGKGNSLNFWTFSRRHQSGPPP